MTVSLHIFHHRHQDTQEQKHFHCSPTDNMRFIEFVAVAAAVVLLAKGSEGVPSSRYGAPVIPILKDERDQDGLGAYTFAYSTGNGIYRNEAGKQAYGQNAEGGWRYTSPEGLPVEITFVANKGGYQPQGAVLPVAPKLPYSRTQRY
ncbi:cuticle protein AMP1A-like [Panulirus ornatus]|uniref:cuticle protein AMP1A-like n=1 Tax=Panulirus ornatus TaxID=150431 RepID=UPI003A84A342